LSIATRDTRADKVWTPEDQEKFMAAATPEMQLAFMIGVWTGQRQGDLLRLACNAYDGTHIRLRQGKTGRRVTIPVGGPLKRLLDATAKRSPTMLTDRKGMPWVPRTFKHAFSVARAKAGIVGLTFNDLRGTFVTRAALRGASEAEIATVTGHSLGDVRRVLDHHYLHRDPQLAESAIRKLESRQDC
jgi:integrase